MPHRPRRLPRVALLVPMALCAAAVTAAPAVSDTPSAKPTISMLNDANHDGAYTNLETVPKNAKFPYTVNYQVTIWTGAADGPNGAQHTITVSDPGAANMGTCAPYTNKVVATNQSLTCVYSVTYGSAASPFIDRTATLTWDGGPPGDVASVTSRTWFDGKCNSGNGNGSDPINPDPMSHCYMGDPGNSYNAGNRGGDEIPGSGGNPNPGGNNVG